MFNLEKEVATFCEQATAGKKGQAELVDELKDHLYCEIEILQRNGQTEEQAFREATQKLGAPAELLSEYRKNRRVFSLMCDNEQPTLNDYAQQRSTVMTYKKTATRIIGQSILWATAILASGLMLGDAEQYTFYMLLLVVLATTSISLDPGYKEAARVECRYFKRLLGIGKHAG